MYLIKFSRLIFSVLGSEIWAEFHIISETIHLFILLCLFSNNQEGLKNWFGGKRGTISFLDLLYYNFIQQSKMLCYIEYTSLLQRKYAKKFGYLKAVLKPNGSLIRPMALWSIWMLTIWQSLLAACYSNSIMSKFMPNSLWLNVFFHTGLFSGWPSFFSPLLF